MWPILRRTNRRRGSSVDEIIEGLVPLHGPLTFDQERLVKERLSISWKKGTLTWRKQELDACGRCGARYSGSQIPTYGMFCGSCGKGQSRQIGSMNLGEKIQAEIDKAHEQLREEGLMWGARGPNWDPNVIEPFTYLSLKDLDIPPYLQFTTEQKQRVREIWEKLVERIRPMLTHILK
jgi:hypothetical protein